EQLGAAPAGSPGLDPVSRRKLRALHALVTRFGPRFAAGPVVPALAVAWRMEEMGVRVFARHVEVLERTSPHAPLLTGIDGIERRAGVLGALALLTAGGWLWIRTKLASSISPSRTDAAT